MVRSPSLVYLISENTVEFILVWKGSPVCYKMYVTWSP